MTGIPLQLSVYPTAVWQRVAIEKEKAPTVSFSYLLNEEAKLFNPQASRKRMLQVIDNTNIQVGVLLKLGQREKVIYGGQPRLPRSGIPVVYPLTSDSWTSVQSLDRINLVRAMAKISQQDKESSDAFDSFMYAQAQYLRQVRQDLRETASRLTRFVGNDKQDLYVRARGIILDNRVIDAKEAAYLKYLSLLEVDRGTALHDALTDVSYWTNEFASETDPLVKPQHLVDFTQLLGMDGHIRYKPDLAKIQSIDKNLALAIWNYIYAFEGKTDNMPSASKTLENAIISVIVNNKKLAQLRALASEGDTREKK